MPLHLDAGLEPIAGYLLVRPLGRGGFGEVWEATAPGGVRVALKFIRLGTIEAGTEQRALEVIRDIRHPHLLDVQFATRVDDCFVIAMPLCDRSLMDRLHACQAQGQPGVPRDELLGYMEDLGRAVDFLNETHHRAGDGGPGLVGVQHRDIKPHNIFLVGGSVRLADFGLAKILQGGTACHTGKMSPNYVAPEVLKGRVSPWSDQYSLAVTYAHLRIGKPPFSGTSVDQILMAHLKAAPDLAALPEQERGVVARALAKRPEDRWPTCRAFVLALAAAARGHDGRLVPPVPSAPTVTETTIDRSTLFTTADPHQIALSLAPSGAGAGDPSPATTAVPAPACRRSRRIVLAGCGVLAGCTVLAGMVVLARHGTSPTSDPDRVPVVAADRPRAVPDPLPVPEAASAVEPERTVDPSVRPLRTEADVLAAIRDHLRQASQGDRAFLRYFTLHNLSNNKDLDDSDLRLARAAVAKLINSLSWRAEVVVPRAIDRELVVLALDLHDVGWDVPDRWQEILTRYPYGLKHDRDRDARVRELATEVAELAGTSMPYVRADWFVATASRPPLYHRLLDLPGDDRSLETMLKVDVESDFLNDKLARAGLTGGGASSQDRVIDRHPARYGAYWKRYEFEEEEGKQRRNLFGLPLGPAFPANPFPHQAFEHAGGEILFHLPNGLLGYLLVDAGGKRLDAGPIAVVSDPHKTSGTAAVVPGLSCMGCHRLGMIAAPDTIRDGLAVAGEPLDKARRLYLTHEAMDRLLARDEARFCRALDDATGELLRVDEDREKPIRDFPEPIGAVACDFHKDLGPDELAAELGLGDPGALIGLIRASSRLRDLGLDPLLRGAAIKRALWESLDGGRSLSRFQQVSRELELGTPFRSF